MVIGAFAALGRRARRLRARPGDCAQRRDRAPRALRVGAAARHGDRQPNRRSALPTGSTARDRIVSPAEAARLIAALRSTDQAALGLAVYAGLRLGELLAVDWAAIDTDAHTIHVRRSWDHGAREYVAAKSKAGTRTVRFSTVSDFCSQTTAY